MNNLSPTAALCQSLLDRPSVTPEDAGCQTMIADRLKACGFSIENMRFGEVDNLWARYGTEAPLFVFAGHTDVVPTGDTTKWTYPPFNSTIVDDMIFGRGAADMKGSIAAMVTAVERLLSDGASPKGSIAFLLTSDEEGPAIDGTVKVIETLQQRNETIDWCIVGEPTSVATLGDTIKNGRRGSISGRLTVFGKQGHVAYPHLADNPIHKALSFLEALVEEHWDTGNDFFPATSLQISNIHAGTGAGNVIPADAVIDFNLRFSSDITPEEIKSRTQSLLNRHQLPHELSWSLSGNPFLTVPGSLTEAIKASIAKHCGIETRLDTGGGTSDGRFIAPTGAQVVELGPRNDTIHQIDECISLSDLDRLSSVYEDIMRDLLHVS